MSIPGNVWPSRLGVRYAECLGNLMVEHGVPEHLRSDNGPEFTARAVRSWLQRVGVQTLFITPGSRVMQWEEGGYVEQLQCHDGMS